MEDKIYLSKVVECRKIELQSNLCLWGKHHIRRFPWRENRSPYSVLISEILLRRTTSTAVKRIYEKFMSLYPNVQELAKADKKQLENLLLNIGFHKQRTRILITIADFIIKTYDSKIPNTKENLLKIPYIGNYTANAILSLSYGIPSAMVDSNVERIIKRVFLRHLPKKVSIRAVQKVADILSPLEDNQNFNYTLLDFGALICRYRIPKCEKCPINNFCNTYLCRKLS